MIVLFFIDWLSYFKLNKWLIIFLDNPQDDPANYQDEYIHPSIEHESNNSSDNEDRTEVISVTSSQPSFEGIPEAQDYARIPSEEFIPEPGYDPVLARLRNEVRTAQNLEDQYATEFARGGGQHYQAMSMEQTKKLGEAKEAVRNYITNNRGEENNVPSAQNPPTTNGINGINGINGVNGSGVGMSDADADDREV